jgi:hypothetical protein
MVGISGLEHGFFEFLQGNRPTDGFFVQAIGPAQRFWSLGTEDAFTIVPNFLASGILAMGMGLVIIIWSVRLIGRPGSSRELAVLGAAQFLVGGGVAAVGFVLLQWLVARRIDRPFGWWRALSRDLAGALMRLWPRLMAVSFVLFGVALEIAIFGLVPGVADPLQRDLVCWSLLLGMVVTVLAALAGASAQDAGCAIEATA